MLITYYFSLNECEMKLPLWRYTDKSKFLVKNITNEFKIVFKAVTARREQKQLSHEY